MHIYIFGDIGGHFDPFMKALAKIGVDPESAEVPPDTCVIQVGDLVHRGPNSDELVEWVDAALKINKGPSRGKWVQLFGNHEGHHIGGPQFGETIDGEFQQYTLSSATEKTLRRWRHSRIAYMAAAVQRTDQGDLPPRDVLVTHAGLCWQTWHGIGEAKTMEEICRRLNAMPNPLAFAPGWMLGGYRKAREGGVQPPSVAWASAAQEVYPSWDMPNPERQCPFDQVHGHTTLWHWFKNNWYCDDSISINIDKDTKRRFTRWNAPGGARFYAIDQALGAKEPYFDVEPLPMKGRLLWPT